MTLCNMIMNPVAVLWCGGSFGSALLAWERTRDILGGGRGGFSAEGLVGRPGLGALPNPNPNPSPSLNPMLTPTLTLTLTEDIHFVRTEYCAINPRN